MNVSTLKPTIVILVMLLGANAFKERKDETYKAAVYEHAVVLPRESILPVSRNTALGNMMKNLEIYRQQVEVARKEGADIIVFPEDGIYGMAMTRIALTPYLEYIPDPKKEAWCPCSEPERYSDSEVQQYLSCLAKNNSMYVVANFGDKQPCNKTSDPECPIFGHYQFNTDLVFDKTGTLIAKYHKENLFFEDQFDKPKSTEFVYFDTTFGRFGVFTCFDIMFHDPAIQLIVKYNVTNIVFPTAWMDALPLLAAIEFHSAFAAGVGVNFLSANIHRPENRFHGSGIYSPDGALTYCYDDKSVNGKLLLGELKIIQPPFPDPPIVNTEGLPYAGQDVDKLYFDANKSATEFHSYVFHDLYTFKLLSEEHEICVCQNSFCCHLVYDFSENNGNDSELFAFGAFDGLHTYQGKYYMQVCTLLKCASTDLKSCGSGTKESSTKFKKIEIEGNFSTNFVFPEILLASNDTLALANRGQWTFVNKKLAFISDELPVLTVSLFGRKYEND